MRHYPRPNLVATLLEDPAEVVVIESPAGTGKTVLLAEIRAADPDRIVIDAEEAPVVLPAGRVIIAKRGETQVAGLARAAVYGKVSLYTAQKMLFTVEDFLQAGESLQDAARLMRVSGGWACLLAAAHQDLPNEAMVAFLSEDILSELSAAQLPALEAYLSERVLSLPVLEGFAFYRAGPLPAVLRLIRVPLLEALVLKRRQFELDLVTARVLARAEAALGNYAAAVRTAQIKGLWDLALELLQEGGGVYFVHLQGIAALDQVMEGFPENLRAENELLVLVRAVQAAKHGEVRLALHILEGFFGTAIHDAKGFITARRKFSLSARLTRILMMIWQEAEIPIGYIDLAYSVLAEVPIEDDLRRGSFYNAILDLHIRSRAFPEAELVAAKAGRHFEKAGIADLAYFIALHRAQVTMHMGHPQKAREFLAAAESYRRAAPGNVQNELLLELTNAALAYEMGHGARILAFIDTKLEAFLEGEIWSAVVDLLVTYGSLAMQQIRGTAAARAFLEKWRALGWQPRLAERLSQSREIVLLQNARRWHEAGGMIEALHPYDYSDAELINMAGRDEITLMLAKFRQLVHQSPAQAGLLERLHCLEGNPHLVWRQKIGVQIWRVVVLLRHRQIAEAERLLLRVLHAVAERGMVAICAEEEEFLRTILRHNRLLEVVEQEEGLRRLLKLRGKLTSEPQVLLDGITRQEARVIDALVEGASNKEIAKLLGISVPTVKFHLSNLYLKFECENRRMLRTLALKSQNADLSE